MRILANIICIICLPLTLIGQQVYIQPPVNSITGCTSISDLYSVTFNNFETNTVSCVMSLDISYSGNNLQQGLIARGTLEGSPTFQLPVGVTNITTSNVGEFFPTRNLQFLDPVLQNINDQSSCLPPGEYEVCITLFGVGTNGVPDLSNQISQTCFTRTKRNSNNIFLISPQNKSQVYIPLPVFTWSPVADFSNRNSNYLFEIVELLKGQTPFEAFRSNPIFFREEGIKTNTLQYPIRARALDECRSYVWRVSYYTDKNFSSGGFNSQIKPSVVSELWRFDSNCGNPNVKDIKALVAPILVSPSNQETIPLENKNIVFTWTDITPTQKTEVTYMLKVIENLGETASDYYFINGDPIISQPIVDNNFFSLLLKDDLLDKEKSYTWGIIPYDSKGKQLIKSQNLERRTFSFENSIRGEEEDNCPLEIDEIIVQDLFLATENMWKAVIGIPGDNFDKIKDEYNIVREVNGVTVSVPPLLGELEVFAPDENAAVSYRLGAIDITPNDENTRSIKVCFRRRFASGSFDCFAESCKEIILSSDPTDKPSLTKFEVIANFPILEEDKTILVKLDIEDNALEFPAYDLEYSEMVFESDDPSIKLDVVESDNTTHTYRLLPKDAVTLEPIDISDEELDISVFDIKTSFDYQILESDDPGGLSAVQLDTSIVLPLIPLSSPCDLQITDLHVTPGSRTYEDGKTTSTFSNLEMEDYFLIEFTHQTNISSTPPIGKKYLRRNQRIDYSNVVSSPVDIRFDTISKGVDQHYAIVPLWDQSNISEDQRENALSYSFDACLSIDMVEYDQNTGNEVYICTRTQCITVSRFEDPCPFDITRFELDSDSTYFQYGDMMPADPDGSFFVYNFDIETSIDDLLQNTSDILFARKYVEIEVVESNIELMITKSEENDFVYEVEPWWFDSPFFSDDELYFKLDVCSYVDIYDQESQLCTESQCFEIIHTPTESTTIIDSNKCKIDFDFLYEKENELVTFQSQIYDQDSSDFSYTYQWKFSDDSTATMEATTHIFGDIQQQWARLIITRVNSEGESCIDSLQKSIRIRPNCDYIACNVPCSGIPSEVVKVGDEIILCGDLIAKVSTLDRATPANLKGTANVRIPWLQSDIEVEFDGITINGSYQLCGGEMNAMQYDNAPTYPDQLGINMGVHYGRSIIESINSWVNNNNIVELINDKNSGTVEEDIVLTSALDAVEPMRVPLGFNKVDVSPSKDTTKHREFTLAVSEFKFTPGQNYIKALAAVEFATTGTQFDVNPYVCFESDNFFFNASGPILNTGNSPDLAFELIEPTTINYGSQGGDPLTLTFNTKDSSPDAYGTGIVMESECNEPYNWCIRADIDIDMPRSWLLPLDDDGVSNVRASVKQELCNLSDYIIQIDLPNCEIANSSGLELEVQNLTWDHSLLRNADQFQFPENYAETNLSEDGLDFRGFYLHTAKVLLPQDLSSYEDSRRLEVGINNFIIHPGYGVSGKVYADNIINFPSMNVSDLGASIDTFRLEMVNSGITYGYLKGEITLPICDQDDPITGLPTSKLDYKAMYGSYPANTVTDGILFQITPQGDFDCPFFAKGRLEIYETSNLYFAFTEDNSAVDFTLHGKLNYPNLEITAPVGDFSYELEMDVDYENINFNYTKPRGGGQGSVLFDHGVWSFASPQKKLNRFNFSIENFKAVTKFNLQEGELFVGGIGFDAVVNLGDRIGGVAGLEVLGSIEKNPGERLKAGYKGLDVSKIGLYANLSAVKLDGEIEFLSDEIYGKAVKGSVSAEFKKVSSAIYAGVLFGNTTTSNNPNGFRYMQVQAKAIWPEPGIPLFPGVGLRGVGAGFYNNMTASFNSNAESIDVSDSSLQTNSSSNNNANDNPNALWPGATFTPARDSLGFRLQFELASTPKEESFNGNLGLSAEINKNTGGLVRLGIDGNVWAGAKMTERNKAFLTGSLAAYYDFTTDIFDLNAAVLIDKPDLLWADVGLHFHVDGRQNRYFFKFGEPNNPNEVKFLGTINSKMYLMFGNYGIYSPPGYFMQETIDGLNEVQPGLASLFDSPNFQSSSLIGTGRGFAAGIGVNANLSKTVPISNKWRAGVNATAGAEFNLSMLDYGPYSYCSCCDFTPIGFNGYYLRTNLAAYLSINAFAEKFKGNNQRTVNLFTLGLAAQLQANFPRPWGAQGALTLNFKVLSIFNVTKTFQTSLGKYCFPTSPTDNETYEQEDVTEDLYIFDQVMIDEGDQEYDNTKPLRWTTPYKPGENFTLPEQQSDGSIVNKSFIVEFEPKLFQKEDAQTSNNWVEIEDDRYNPAWGLDPIGRWFHVYDGGPNRNKRIELYPRRPDGGMAKINNANPQGHTVNHGKIYVGNFDGSGGDDILYKTNPQGGAYVRKKGAFPFLDPVIWTNVFIGDAEWLVGNFNGDQYDDIGYFDPSIGFKVLLSNGSSFDPPTLWLSLEDIESNQQESGGRNLDSEIFSLMGFSRIFQVGDFDVDGYDDIAYHLNTDKNQKTVFLSNGDSEFSSVSFQWSMFSPTNTPEGNYGFNIFNREPNIGRFNNDDKFDWFTETTWENNTYIDFNLSPIFPSGGTAGQLIFESRDITDVILGDFDGNGFDDLLVHFPGDGHIEADEILYNSLNPNTEYKFVLEGYIEETSTGQKVAEETIIRVFKTDENGEIFAGSNDSSSSSSGPGRTQSVVVPPNANIPQNVIPDSPPMIIIPSTTKSTKRR